MLQAHRWQNFLNALSATNDIPKTIIYSLNPNDNASIGTIIGCCVEYLVYPLLPGIGWKLLFAVAMLCLMYCATPGTWNHPIFSTCYALTLAP